MPSRSIRVWELTKEERLFIRLFVMKKYITSTLCSAFVVPGLGQIINEQIKKGLLLLGLVFILLVAIIAKVTVAMNHLVTDSDMVNIDLNKIAEKIANEDLSLISILALCFVLMWIYSIIDAFWIGWKIERGKVTQKDEILPH
jgi:TM2 domain-containing membrane protein YozV